MDDDSVSVAVIASRLFDIEKKIDKVLDDHETRLRNVERWVYAMPATLLVAVASVIVALLS